jgi:hypothetical protein
MSLEVIINDILDKNPDISDEDLIALVNEYVNG